MNLLNKSKDNRIKIFISGMAVGLAVFLLIYGFKILNFSDDSLISSGYIEKDLAQHYAGWMLYRNSPWQFPLGVGQHMAYPYGTSVSFTDSIPLFAVLFKIFRGILPSTFQYFGLFVLLCFMLQGGFGALLANHFNEETTGNIIARAIFVLSPVMIERAFRHCSLTAHFLILASLYYYFLGKEKEGIKAYIPFFVINAFAITIHPYFLPFTFGIMFALCAEKFILKKEYIKSCGSLIVSMALTVIVGYCFGAFYFSGSMGDIGYGYYNMNLNALYNPVSRGFENWSKILEIKPNVLGEIEAFNYIGLGVLLFIPASVLSFILRYKKELFTTLKDFIKNNFGLVFSASALTIFAIGDWVRFGGLDLFRLPIPFNTNRSIWGIFRANGRFGNLLVYLIALFIIWSVLKIDNKKLSSALMICLLMIQIIDMRGALISKYNYFHDKTYDLQGQVVEKEAKSRFWDIAAEEFEEIHLVGLDTSNSLIDVASKFAKNNKKVNLRFEARVNWDEYFSNEYRIMAMIENGNLPDSMLVITSEIYPETGEYIKENNYSLFYADGFYIITSNNDILEKVNSLNDNFEIIDPYTFDFSRTIIEREY